MTNLLTRRQFISGIGVAAALSSESKSLIARMLEPPVLPLARSEIRWGCAAITWSENDVQAIKDIADVGFRGIQLRTSVLKEFGDRPNALRELLDQHHLTMVAFSSGGVRIEPGTEADQIALHTRHAQFVRDVGGFYLQLTDSARPKDRQPTADDYKKLGKMLTEISQRVVDLGLQVGYHNHMNTLGEAPDEVDRILDAADSRSVKLLLDVAHYHQGGGDPAKAINTYRDRLLFLHIKDVESVSPPPGTDPKRSYRFVELGRGRVNLPAIFAALKEINFRGWAIVELDRVPDPSRTPKESALISKKYIEEKLGMKI